MFSNRNLKNKNPNIRIILRIVLKIYLCPKEIFHSECRNERDFENTSAKTQERNMIDP